MTVAEIVMGIILLLCCLVIIFLCLSQDSKAQNSMTSAITGASSDSFYGKNEGRTKEAKLIKATKISLIVFFVLTLAINIVPLVVK
ncbi:MAG: preprotein translocase subunit SecG [Oscillospiraceae bacterium]|nr:preprotein translocase subunit SecG [Oscillospiraceae bacterium]